MDFGSALAGLAFKTAEQSATNAINLGFSRRANQENLRQAKRLNEISMLNEEIAPQKQIAGLKKSGINPFMQGASVSSAPTSPSPSIPYSGSAGSSDFSALARLSSEIENIQSVSNLNNANARKAKADAEAQERENLHTRSYDDRLTELYNKLFPQETNGEQTFYYVNKGDFDADIDVALRYAEVSKSEAYKLQAEWNKFYYRSLLDDKEAQEKFIEAFKAQQTKLINEAKASGKNLDSLDLDIDIKKLSKRLNEITKDTLEHTNLHAFLSKENKTIGDYAEFFAGLLLAALVPAATN